MYEWRRNTLFPDRINFSLLYSTLNMLFKLCNPVCVCTCIRLTLCVEAPLLNHHFLGEARHSSSNLTGCSFISDAIRKSCCVTSTSGQSLAPMNRINYEIICVYPSAALLLPQLR